MPAIRIRTEADAFLEASEIPPRFHEALRTEAIRRLELGEGDRLSEAMALAMAAWRRRGPEGLISAAARGFAYVAAGAGL